MDITDRHIKMISPAGFDALFEQEINNHPTHEQAFNSLNEEYLAAFGKVRYSNFESYRITRLQRIRRKLNKSTIT